MLSTGEASSRSSISRISIRENYDEIRATWLKLQSAMDYSYFLSWGWVSIWLDTVQQNSVVDFVVFRSNGEPYCCFFLGVRKELHNFLFYKTRGYFNETGDNEIDDLTIEYNAVMGSIEREDWNHLVLDHRFTDLEEIHLRNITKQAFDQIDFREHYQFRTSREKPSYYVDLSLIRGNDKSYLALLKSNTRSQIKKSLAYYQGFENLKVREAGSVSEALSYLAELKSLHQSQWTSRGEPGAFATEYFTKFHQRLVKERFDLGEIQLLEIGNSSRKIGYLYSFIHRNRVYYYQSGFCYETESVARPGIICHYLAVEYNLAAGREIYSFLAGDSQYKRSMSTHHDNLYDVVAVRDGLKWRLENGLRAAKRIFAAWAGR